MKRGVWLSWLGLICLCGLALRWHDGLATAEILAAVDLAQEKLKRVKSTKTDGPEEGPER